MSFLRYLRQTVTKSDISMRYDLDIMNDERPKIFTFTLRLAVESYNVEDAFILVMDEIQNNPENVISDVVYETAESVSTFCPFYMDNLGLNEEKEVLWTEQCAED